MGRYIDDDIIMYLAGLGLGALLGYIQGRADEAETQRRKNFRNRLRELEEELSDEEGE